MSTMLIQSETLENIADAIRNKTGSIDTMSPSEMVTEINSIIIGSNHYWDYIPPHPPMTYVVFENNTHPSEAIDIEDGEITVTDSDNAWSECKLFRTEIPNDKNTLKVHFDSLVLNDYAGFIVIPTDTDKSGVLSGSENVLFDETRCYIKTGENGVINETNYELEINFATMTDKKYIYFGLVTGCKEGQPSGFNSQYNGTGSCKIGWIDFKNTAADLQFKNYAKFNGTIGGITLPFEVNSDHTITCTFYDKVYGYNQSIMGTNRTTDANQHIHLTTFNSKYYNSTQAGLETNFGSWSAGEHTYVNNDSNNKNTFDGVEVQSFVPYTNTDKYVIAYRYGANPYQGYIKLYKIEKISDGSKVCEIKPCLVNGLIPVLYDTVNDVAYTLSGLTVMDSIPS